MSKPIFISILFVALVDMLYNELFYIYFTDLQFNNTKQIPL